MLELLTHLTLSDIESQIDNRSLVLFSPRLRNRNALMVAFLSIPDVYCHTLASNETTLSLLVNALVADLRETFPDFGVQTLTALKSSPNDLADALLSDLKHLKSNLQILILDDFDHLAANDEVNAFFQRLGTKLPHGIKIVINGRFLGCKPWGELVRSGHAVYLGEEQALDGGVFTVSTDRPQLEVYGFGSGHVYMNGLTIETWDGPLPRNLFFYFIDHPMITREEIFEAFWPRLSTKDATNVYHVTKRKLNERLGYELSSYSSGFYRQSDQIQLHYDVTTFEKDVALGLEGGNEAIAPLNRAIKLYRHEFLHNKKMPWIKHRREDLRLTYANALIGLARIYVSRKDTDWAISLYLRALREVPDREDIHRDVMTIYLERGEKEKAIAQYTALEAGLKDKFGIAPSAATRTLYQILTGHTHA